MRATSSDKPTAARPGNGPSLPPPPKARRVPQGLLVALVVYMILFVVKLIAWLQSGLLVVFAEALHSLADFLVSGFLIMATYWAAAPADENHAFGHGRAQFVAAVAAATIFITVTSLEGFRQAVPALLAGPRPPPGDVRFPLLVLVASLGLSFVPLAKLLHDRRQGIWGATSQAQLTETINDILALIAAIAGVIGAANRIWWADATGAIVVSTIIAVNGAILFRENAIYLMGRAPEPAELRRMAKSIRKVPGVLDMHDVRAEYISPAELYASVHVEIKRGTPIEDADIVAEAVKDALAKDHRCTICTVHVDPEGSESGLVPGAHS